MRIQCRGGSWNRPTTTSRTYANPNPVAGVDLEPASWMPFQRGLPQRPPYHPPLTP